MKALSHAMPGNVSAGIGNLKVIAFSGLKDETHWVHMEIFEGSYGGRLGKDGGIDAGHTLYANTRNNPIEDIETHLPLRVLRRTARGRVRRRQVARRPVLGARVHVPERRRRLVEGEGHRYRPWGFFGGGERARRPSSVSPAAPRAPSVQGARMNIAKDGRFVCYGPGQSDGPATRWSAIRRRWRTTCWTK